MAKLDKAELLQAFDTVNFKNRYRLSLQFGEDQVAVAFDTESTADQVAEALRSLADLIASK